MEEKTSPVVGRSSEDPDLTHPVYKIGTLSSHLTTKVNEYHCQSKTISNQQVFQTFTHYKELTKAELSHLSYKSYR
jgi:hypothetical protein